MYQPSIFAYFILFFNNQNLLHQLRIKKIDIICRSSHRRCSVRKSGLRNFAKFTGVFWTLIISSSQKNLSYCPQGVVILFNPHSHKSLLSIEKISPRIVVATFNGNPQTTEIACYSPTYVSDEEDVMQFYNELASFLHFCFVLKHNALLIAGDMNAYPEAAVQTCSQETVF